jgi:hypothetical protein
LGSRHETSPQKISAFGRRRCHAAGGVAHRAGASLSFAASAHHRGFSLAEWDSLMDRTDNGPYPGDPDDAQDRIRQTHGAEWSRWELTCHDVEISAAK